MHIAIATTEFVTEKNFAGGLANYTANLARILHKNGHEVSIFVISSDKGEFVWENGIRVYRVHYNEKVLHNKYNLIKYIIYGGWAYLGKSILINRKINNVNGNRKIDIIHFANSDSLVLFRNRKIPCIVRISNYAPMWRHAQKQEFDYEKGTFDLALVEKLQFFSMKRADAIFGPSNIIAELTQKRINRPVSVIESPFYITNIDIDESIYREKLVNKKYFLFYGTLGYLKGIQTIVSILDEFFKKYSDFYFVFVGNTTKMFYEGEELDAAEYLYKSVPLHHDKIIYLPAMNNKKQLYGIIKYAEAIVLPSRIDNLPNTCIESMALEKIVIGTRGASFEQLIEDGESGFLIERENEKQLFEKMETVISLDSEKREKIQKKAREQLGRLEPNNIYLKVISFYNNTVKEVIGADDE